MLLPLVQVQFRDYMHLEYTGSFQARRGKVSSTLLL